MKERTGRVGKKPGRTSHMPASLTPPRPPSSASSAAASRRRQSSPKSMLRANSRCPPPWSFTLAPIRHGLSPGFFQHCRAIFTFAGLCGSQGSFGTHLPPLRHAFPYCSLLILVPRRPPRPSGSACADTGDEIRPKPRVCHVARVGWERGGGPRVSRRAPDCSGRSSIF